MYTFSWICFGTIIAACLIQAAVFFTNRYRPLSPRNKKLAKLNKFVREWYIYSDSTDSYLFQISFKHKDGKRMFLRYRNHPFIVQDFKSVNEVGFTSDTYSTQRNIILDDVITALESLTSAGLIQKRP